MTLARHHLPPSVALLLGLVVLAGCSEGGAPSSTPATDGPLTTMLADVYAIPSQADLDAEQNEIENLVAKCMSAEGFEYFPQDRSGSVSVSAFVDIGHHTEEWVVENGYGFATEMSILDAAAEAEPAEQEVDPNMTYVMGLSRAEASAYNAALSGGYGEQLAAIDAAVADDTLDPDSPMDEIDDDWRTPTTRCLLSARPRARSMPTRVAGPRPRPR